MAKKVISSEFTVRSKKQKSTNYQLPTTNSIMEQLLASLPQKRVVLFRNQEVEGEIVATGDKEIILDLKAKSEGVIAKKEFDTNQISNLKVGQKIKAFVVEVENENGQTVLSLSPRQLRVSKTRRGGISYDNFTGAQIQKRKLAGQIVEINKGGLIVEVSGTTGFLPNSQVGFDLLSKLGINSQDIIGQTIDIVVIEVDQANSRLIFSQRTKLSDDVRNKLAQFKSGQEVKGTIIAILPFGLVIDIKGAEGLVFISDVAWEKVSDLSSKFKVGEEIGTKVIGIDLELGKLNLSIKHLSEDPFMKASGVFTSDEVVRGEITNVSESGVAVLLKDGVEGFLSASKVAPNAKYEIGQILNFLVDNVDIQRRRVNLAPMITSTEGLIYK